MNILLLNAFLLTSDKTLLVPPFAPPTVPLDDGVVNLDLYLGSVFTPVETKTLSKKFLNLFGLDTLVVTEGLFVFSLLPEKDEDVTDALVFLLLTDVNGVSVFVTLAVTPECTRIMNFDQEINYTLFII